MIVVGGRRYREEDASRLGLLGPGGVTPVENDKPEGKTSDEVVDGDGGHTPDADTGEDSKRPAKAAKKDEWVAYALANGKTEEELEDLSKDQIIELFPAE